MFWQYLRQIYFSKDPRVAREYAHKRAKGESDQPAIVMCSIDLNKYNEYERRGTIFIFNTDYIASEVIRNVKGVAGLMRQHREKRKKRGDSSSEQTRNTDVALTFGSGHAGIAYWLNSFLKPSESDKIDEDHEIVESIKQWLEAQADNEISDVVPDDEIRGKIQGYFIHKT